MKTLLFMVIPLALMGAACSGDNEPSKPDSKTSGKEISFYATAPKGTRAPSTTTATLQDFIVYAFTDSSVIMNTFFTPSFKSFTSDTTEPKVVPSLPA